MPSTKRKLSRATLSTGPWTGVYDTFDPFDSSVDKLRDALNIDIPDPEGKSNAFARNGFDLGNLGNAVTSAFAPLYGQWIHTHTALNGTTINLVIVAGKLLRLGAVTSGPMTITDVTPVGISINSGNGPIPITSLLDNIIVNDGISRPWVGTNLTATPITGTYIDYDGAGVAWTAFGQARVWQGSVLFILAAVAGVARRDDISWSEPGLPGTGWQQSGFDNNATMTQTATGPLFGLAATNLALYYFRANSIGAVSGDLFLNFSTNATHDAVSANVGCTAWATIKQAGTSIFFADARGRPYKMISGDAPQPIWEQMRAVTQQHGGNAADQLLTFASSVIDPTLNRYFVTLWRPDVSAADTSSPTTVYVFTADTGTYLGRWTIGDLGDGAGGVGISVMGLLNGADNNEPTLCLLGEKVVGSQSLGFLWFLRVRGWPFPDPDQWLDRFVRPYVVVTTDPLGEAEDVVYTVDRVGIITNNASPCAITIQTPNASAAVIGTPAVNGLSNDSTYRLIAGVSGVQGRGPAITVSPQSNDPTLTQWSIGKINLVAVASTAGPEDL